MRIISLAIFNVAVERFLFRLSPNGGGWVGGNILVELVQQLIDIHIVHEGAVFEGVEIHRKTLTATHVHTREKFHRLGIGADYFADFRVFFYDHSLLDQLTCPI